MTVTVTPEEFSLVFYDAGDGEQKSGKQGVAFRAALLPQMIDALRSYEEADA